MSLKRWLYYLTEADGRSNKVVNGVVTSTGTPTPLPNTPDGWQRILISWERDRNRHGLIRSYSDTLSFVLDGAKILRDVYLKNIERKLYLIIQKLTLDINSTNYRWLYKTFYKGELDFSTMKDGVDTVDINIMQGGLHKLLKANESTVYEIPFDDDAVRVKLDGITLFEKGAYQLVDELEIKKSVYATNIYLPLTFVGKEVTLPFFTMLSQTLQATPAAWADKLTDDNFILQAAESNEGTINVRVTGKIKYVCTENTLDQFSFRVRFIRSNQDIVNQNDYSLFFTSVPVEGSLYSYDIDITIPLQPGERLYLEGIITGGSPGATEFNFQFSSGSTLDFSYQARGAATYAKAFMRKTLFRKLCKRIFGHEDYAVSTLLETDNRAITSMNEIRGIEGANIKTSMKDFLDDINKDLMTGDGIIDGAATANLPAGQRHTIETRETFYDDSDPIDLGEIKDMAVAYGQPYAISKIVSGWKKPEIENLNGKYAFNSSTEWVTPIKSMTGEYNLVSPYKADPYDIEITRVIMAGKTTTDKRNDNDVVVLVVDEVQEDTTATLSFVADGGLMIAPNGIQFYPGQKIRITGTASNDGEWFIDAVASVLFAQIIAISGAGTVVDESSVSADIEWIMGRGTSLKRDSWDNIGDPDDFGVPSPATIFNIDLSPARKIRRHGRWIRSVMQGFDAEKIQFVSGDMNTSLKTVEGTETIKENGDISISTLGERIFIPWIITAKSNVREDLWELLEENANRCCKWTEDGVEYHGFILNAGLAPNELNEQEFALLSVPGNDFTQRN